MSEIPYGLKAAVPPDAPTAWGARLIVTQDGYVDFVPDRQGCAGEGLEAFLAQLNVEFGLPELCSAISGLLREGKMSTRETRDFTLYRSSALEVRANTNGSAGYCYVAAWALPKDTP